MKSVSISGSPRENVGKKDAKKIRREGKVPCVLYGGKDQVHFAAEETSFKKLVYTPDAYTVKLDISGKAYEAILQDIQYHPISDGIIHADFLEIFPDKEVTTHIPIKITGVAPGILKGGKLIQKLRKLKIKALPANLPDYVTLDITPLEIGSTINVCDVKMDQVAFLDSPNAMILGVRVTRAVVEEAPKAAEGAAPAAGAAPVAATPATPAAKSKEAKK